MQRLDLLNRWQHGFPLESRPFARIGAALGVDEAAVIAGFEAARADGSLSRIGGVWAAGAGGAALLVAMARPDGRQVWVNFAVPDYDRVQVIDMLTR